MQFVLATLLFALGCVCLITVATIFGAVMTFTQAAAVMILVILFTAIAKTS
jgi:hypothetical protein